MTQEALTQAQGSRVQYLEIAPELLLSLLKIPPKGVVINQTLVTVEKDAIPPTARALRAGINECGNVILVIEDESFPLVYPGYVMKQICPLYAASPALDRTA